MGGGAMLGLLAGLDPKLAILASITCAYVLLTFADLSVGLSLFIVLSSLETLAVGGTAVTVTKLLGLVLALSWLALVATRDEARTDLVSAHPIASYVLALLVGWTVLSLIWSDSPSDAVSVSYRLLLDAILYVIVYTAVRDRRTAHLTVGAFVTGAAASAVYGLIVRPQATDVSGRLAGGGLDPNELGSILVAGIVLSVGLAGVAKRGTGRSLVALGVAGICLLSLFLTASRGGLVALSVAILAAIVFGGRWRGLVAILAVMIFASGYFYFSALAPQSARDRIAQVTQGQAGQAEGRATIWKVGWRMFEANPVLGVGAGNFSQASIKYVVRPGEAPRSDRLVSQPAVAHNSYLEVLAELGLVGGLLFFGLIAFSFGSAVAAARRFRRLGDRAMEILSRSLVAGLAGVLAADFFISEEVSKQFWLLLALGPAFLGIAMRAAPRNQRSRSGA